MKSKLVFLNLVTIVFFGAGFSAYSAGNEVPNELILVACPGVSPQKVQKALKKMNAILEDTNPDGGSTSYLVKVGNVDQAMIAAAKAKIFAKVMRNHQL
jgi:hypothetical protein